MLKKKKKPIIESDFSFLIEHGFSLEKYIRPPDVECVYSRDNLSISVTYYIGVLETYKKTMCFDIILTIDGNRENLLNCTEIFGVDSIIDLLMKIRYMSASEQIPVYARFLQENINKLLNKG